MQSFEGQFKKPRTINYNKEIPLGSKDVVQKAKVEREKRALNVQRSQSAARIQRAYRRFLVRKRKKQEYRLEFDRLLSDIVAGSSNADYLRCADRLCVLWENNEHGCAILRHFIERVLKEQLISNIFTVSSPNYYHTVTLSLLVRLAIRYLSNPNESCLSSNFVIFRFIEVVMCEFDKCQQLSIRTKVSFLRMLTTSSCYFQNICDFIENLFVNDLFHQPNVRSRLEIILSLIHYSRQLSNFPDCILRCVNTVCCAMKDPDSDNSIKLLRVLTNTFMNVIGLDSFVSACFDHSSDVQMCPAFILVLLYSSVEHRSPLAPNLAAQIIVIFSRVCRMLINSNQLYLSNNFTRIEDLGLSEHLKYFQSKTLSVDEDSLISEGETGDSSLSTSSDEEEFERKTKMSMKTFKELKLMNKLEEEIALYLKNHFASRILSQAVKVDENAINIKEVVSSIGYIYHLLVLQSKIANSTESKSFILNLIECSPSLSKQLWESCVSQKSDENKRPLIQSLINGQISLNKHEVDEFFGKLLCFANLLHWRLLSVQDLDLIKSDSVSYSDLVGFTTAELCRIVLQLRDVMYGLILLIYPSSSDPMLRGGCRDLQQQMRQKEMRFVKVFIELQRVVMRLYNRDVRKGLQTSGKRLDWVKNDVCRINIKKMVTNNKALVQGHQFGRQQQQLGHADMRQVALLKEMPFCVPFGSRMRLFKEVIQSMRQADRNPMMRETVRIRRDHLYEDAFSQITQSNIGNLTNRLQIQFIDSFGMLEEGVDGGGLMREFLNTVVREACDPKRGLFVTTNNNMLYPNPDVDIIYRENWRKHMQFFGRMLGIIIFKGLVVDVPFAPFFLQRLFSSRTSSREEIDIDNLQYLDEQLYRNLLSLKSMNNVDEMSLDFTVNRCCYGESQLVELKRNGSNIPVTNGNKIEYIYLVSDYKLNRQIAKPTAVIVSGINDVFPVECFRLFDLDEISLLITGGEMSIDIEDLRRNTVYHGVDDPEQSVIVQNFWMVLFEMKEDEKRNFIQFVTSISRAPLLGFGELNPKFGIQIVPDTDRLPTASTCLNLLKLPAYTDLKEMREKLLFAIGSDSGFYLS